MNPVKINGSVPKLHEDLIPYMENLGWKYEGKNILGKYLFTSKTKRIAGPNAIDFSLRELREAFLYGW